MVPKLDRKERDKFIRRKDILNAAEYIFATKGYHNSKISDIAKHAQYAVGTLYLYFKDKEEIYITLIEEKTKNLIATVQKNVDTQKNPHDKIRTLIKTYLLSLQEDEYFLRIYFSEVMSSHSTSKNKIFQKMMGIIFGFIDFITNVVREAQKANFLRNDADPRRLAFLLAGNLRAVMMSRLLTDKLEAEDMEKVSDFILDMFLNGAGKNK